MSTIMIIAIMLLATIAVFFLLLQVRKIANNEKSVQMADIPSYEKVTLLEQYYGNNGIETDPNQILDKTDYVLNKFF